MRRMDMKKIFLIVSMLFDASLMAMEIDSEQKSSETPFQKFQTLRQASRQTQKADEKTQQLQQDEDYQDIKKFITAIVQANEKEVTEILKTSGWCNESQCFLHMVERYKTRLKQDFGEQFKDLLHGQWPFTPVWLALELVIANKGKEDSAIYDNRVSILKTLASRIYDHKGEELILRKHRPPSSASWWFVCCCCPLLEMCTSVKGFPIHRAAESDNTDALKIFVDAECLYVKDAAEIQEEAWTPIKYAFASSARNCAAYLIEKRAHLTGERSQCCQDIRCLAGCFSDKETREILTDAPNYEPMCCGC